MKKILIILLFIPLFSWSQNLNFTTEQEAFVNDLFVELWEKDSQKQLSSEAVIKELDNALLVAPYHPRLVQSLLYNKFYLSKDFKFVKEFCNQLDDSYLSIHQNFLIEYCVPSFQFTEEDLATLYNRLIPLIENQATKDLFLAFYYYDTDQEEKFFKYAMYSVSRKFEYQSTIDFRNSIFGHLLPKLYNAKDYDRLMKIVNNYEETIFSANLSPRHFNFLLEATVFTNNFDKAEKLLERIKKADPENYKYLYPISALVYSKKGEQSLAIAALEKAFEMPDSDFKKIVDLYGIEGDIFHLYSHSIREFDDLKTRERLLDKAILYFENRSHYLIRFKLHRSLLHARKDIKKARAILKSHEGCLEEQKNKDVDNLISIANEVGKKKPNYRLVDNLMREVFLNFNYPSMKFERILFQYKVNYNAEQPVFTLTEMVDGLNQLLESPLDEDTRRTYLYCKILLIGEKDQEWAMRELEALGEDKMDNILSELESVINDKEKAAALLIINTKELKDINGSINIISGVYINMITCKE